MDFFLAHTLAAERGGEIAMTELYAEYKKFVKDRSEASDAEPEEKARLYDLIASFAIRRALCGLSTNNYTRVFNRLATMLRADGVTVAMLLRALAEQTGDSFRFPRDDELSSAIASRRQYGSQNQRRLRHILEEFELAARSPFDENTSIPDDLTIEHVLPDEWPEFWPLPDGRKVPLNRATGVDERMRAVIAERDRIKHVLGNLTLVTGANNPSLGKLAFSKKRERLQSSLLKLNQEIARETHWDEEAIARRSVWLSTLALKIWPGPVTAS